MSILPGKVGFSLSFLLCKFHAQLTLSGRQVGVACRSLACCPCSSRTCASNQRQSRMPHFATSQFFPLQLTSLEQILLPSRSNYVMESKEKNQIMRTFLSKLCTSFLQKNPSLPVVSIRLLNSWYSINGFLKYATQIFEAIARFIKRK